MPHAAAPATQDPHHAHRWLILGIIGIAQLMVVLDATIVNIALPSAQDALGFSDDNRQWVITAYALAFGSFLLLGGRIGDLFGRKQVFVVGLLGFAVASAIGGAAGSLGVLVFARALQGVFGALLAPAALSILTTTFTDPAERGKAFGVFGAIAGAGAGVGLLLGGVLTEYLSWRWCLYVNLAFAIPAAIGGLAYLHGRQESDGERPPLDLPGTITVSAGLFALVYGVSNAETNGWGDSVTIVMLIASAVLLAAFATIQRRATHPLLPLRVILDRNRGGAYLAIGIVGVGMFGAFLFLTFYMQRTLELSPVETGLAFMPMNLAIMAAATLASANLLPRFGPRPLITAGMLFAAIGMALFTQLHTDSSFWTGVLPGLMVMGVGLGLVFATSMATATLGIAPHDAGVGSAMVNTTQQVGGSIGIALLSTLFASAAASFVPEAGMTPADIEGEAIVHGYSVAYWWAAGILTAGAVVCGLLLRPGAQVELDPDAAPVVAH